MDTISLTKKNGVKDDFLSLQALAENLMLLFSRGLQLVSRLCIFTVLDLYEMYFPLPDIELVNSAQILVMFMSISIWG